MAARTTDPLKGRVACVEAGELEVLEVRRYPEHFTGRSVVGQFGKMAVSVDDGYRVMLATPNKAPFVNLKIEKSAKGHFNADRAAILAQMQKMSDERGPSADPIRTSWQDDMEVVELHQPVLALPGPMSFVTIFVPTDGVVATAYILNQEEGRRAFQTMEEYHAMAQRFIAQLLKCLRTPP